LTAYQKISDNVAWVKIDLSKTDFIPLKRKEILSSGSIEDFIEEVAPVFNNITTLLDCITCDKCKLHAKLQVNSLFTKIFSFLDFQLLLESFTQITKKLI